MTKNYYKRYYYIFVITIIAITLFSQVIIRYHLKDQENDGSKISVARGQTAVAEKIAKLSLVLMFNSPSDAAKKSTELELKKALDKLNSRHTDLQFGNKSIKLDGVNSEKSNKLLLTAKSSLEDLNSIISKLLAGSIISSDELNALTSNAELYGQKLKEVTYDYSQANQKKISALKTLELILALLMIGILILEIFYVIRPALVKLTEKHKELKQTNEELVRLNQVKSDFLANMSHEIRTPLNGVIGMSHVLSQGSLNEDQKDSVKTIKTSAQNLLDIINEILDFSKLESGNIGVEEVSFSLHQTVDEVLEILAPTAHSKGIGLFSYINPKIPKKINTDDVKVKQVLTNLIGNAIKFTDHGEVTLEIDLLSSEANYAELIFSVKDSGIGIAKHKQDEIFNSFTQADNSTTRKYGGTGLGLSICKDLVGLLNGKIWVESEPNVGSIFHFSLVAATSEEHVLIREQANSLEGKRVMLVDDNETNLKILVKILSNWGVMCTPFNNPELVRSVISSIKDFDFCILDMQMPELSGSKLSREIKAVSPKTPVLMLSSVPEELIEDKNPAYDFFLNKPLKQLKLLSILSNLFSDNETKMGITEPKKPEKTVSFSSGIKVLVVEDNAINRAVATKSLELLGLPATTAVDGEEALKLIKSELFDLVLMDIQMPKLDGFQTTKAIRKMLSQNDQPVIIAMTAASPDAVTSEYTSKGMDDFLPKPLDLDDLTEKINNWFE